MKPKINWDAFGIAASAACAIHCAVLPLVLSSLPLFGINIIHNRMFEYGMIVLALCIGIYSLQHGKKHHGKLLPVIIFSAGIVFLFAKEIWSEKEILLLIPAVLLIVTAHCTNYFFARKYKPAEK